MTVYDEAYVRELSRRVYLARMRKQDRERLRAEPDFERKLDARAQGYDRLTRAYLDAIRSYGVRPEK